MGELKVTRGTITVALKTISSLDDFSVKVTEGWIDKCSASGTYHKNKNKWVIDQVGIARDKYFDSSEQNFRKATPEEEELFRKRGAHLISNNIEEIKKGLDNLEKILT